MTRVDRWLTRILDSRLGRRLFEKECIYHAGVPVLYRWILLRLPGGASVYLHHFMRSDGREMHDHPKPFTTIGLKGGYMEVSAEPGNLDRERRTWYHAPWVRRFPAHHIHRVTIPPGETCWTLAIVGRRRRAWGFFVPAAVERWLDHPWADGARRHRWVHADDFHALRSPADRAADPATADGYRLPDGRRPSEMGNARGTGAEPADAQGLRRGRRRGMISNV